MATSKPKIQGYVEQATFERFEAFRIEQGMSQSQALDAVIAGFFNLERSQQTEAINTKLADLEESIESLNKLCKYSFKHAFGKIGKLERITSNLPSDTPEITSNLPSDTPEITNQLGSLERAINKFIELKRLDWGKNSRQKGEFSTESRTWDIFRQFMELARSQKELLHD